MRLCAGTASGRAYTASAPRTRLTPCNAPYIGGAHVPTGQLTPARATGILCPLAIGSVHPPGQPAQA